MFADAAVSMIHLGFFQTCVHTHANSTYRQKTLPYKHIQVQSPEQQHDIKTKTIRSITTRHTHIDIVNKEIEHLILHTHTHRDHKTRIAANTQIQASTQQHNTLNITKHI